MLTTAAWPAASRYFRPSEENIQEPSPRTAVGKAFLKLRGKRNEVTARDSSRGRGDNAETRSTQRSAESTTGNGLCHKDGPGSVVGWRGNFLEEVNAEFYAFHNCLNNFIFRNSF